MDGIQVNRSSYLAMTISDLTGVKVIPGWIDMEAKHSWRSLHTQGIVFLFHSSVRIQNTQQ